jgi:hypothetical protein
MYFMKQSMRNSDKCNLLLLTTNIQTENGPERGPCATGIKRHDIKKYTIKNYITITGDRVPYVFPVRYETLNRPWRAIGVFPVRHEHYLHIKGKAISVTDRGGIYGFEMSRIPHFIDNWFTDGGKVVGLTH